MRRLLAISTLLATCSLSAQQVHYTRFLVPFVDKPAAAGSYGSRWETRTWLFNGALQLVTIAPPAYCIIECPGVALISPQRTLPTFFAAKYTGDSPAVLFHVDSRFADDVSFNSRVRDVSRSDSAGTEVPVIREDRLFTRPIELLNVPLAPHFRVMLRAYALPEAIAPAVAVRYFDQNTDQLLFSEVVPLTTYPHVNGIPGVVSFTPSIATRGGIETEPGLAGETALRIEVEPASSDLRFWAFISVTNNETQQVTLVTPR